MGIALLKWKYNWKKNAVTVKQNVLTPDMAAALREIIEAKSQAAAAMEAANRSIGSKIFGSFGGGSVYES
ncbi:hypothetical protein PM3016_2137 [Paenibacillus mucilaginosus 3016]|uniref:Uncharacterized protein n=1 Tax=Paenibacillus mucilaginosus 3016 TaxID=1116391 RepID=H6NF26_9BACL|nr:hypothetical protein PM3016_2137 [Paenibacillus mucilaginosus 3016]WFA17773.1 hypothetical protein ERY13_11045 [Paenibacillus mucilaginosus]